jgi:hypothetical protein
MAMDKRTQSNNLKITTNIKKANLVPIVCHMLQLHQKWAPLLNSNICIWRCSQIHLKAKQVKTNLEAHHI